jgi:hypothetical protein
MILHDREGAYLNKLIKKKFTTSFMSNKKWIKLITALVENSLEIKECKVKPIWDDELPTRQLLIDEDIQFGFDFYDSSMESMISGNPKGWYAYKEIEWLDFPRIVISYDKKRTAITEEQNLELIKSKIEEIGQFHMELTNDNLRLYAYLR